MKQCSIYLMLALFCSIAVCKGSTKDLLAVEQYATFVDVDEGTVFKAPAAVIKHALQPFTGLSEGEVIIVRGPQDYFFYAYVPFDTPRERPYVVIRLHRKDQKIGTLHKVSWNAVGKLSTQRQDSFKTRLDELAKRKARKKVTIGDPQVLEFWKKTAPQDVGQKPTPTPPQSPSQRGAPSKNIPE